jgi:hypothetical protein
MPPVGDKPLSPGTGGEGSRGAFGGVLATVALAWGFYLLAWHGILVSARGRSLQVAGHEMTQYTGATAICIHIGCGVLFNSVYIGCGLFQYGHPCIHTYGVWPYRSARETDELPMTRGHTIGTILEPHE